MNWMYELLTGPHGEPLEQFAARIGREMERLITTEERFNLGVRLARVGIFRINRDLRYEWAYNPNFDDRSEPASVVGKGSHDLFAPEDADLLDCLYTEAFTTGLPQAFDMRLRSLGTQRERHLEMLIESVRGAGGEITALTAAALDLSPEVERSDEVRRARREANQARTEAEQANRAKTRFMATAAHDLRQPLQAMRFFQNVVADHFSQSGDETGLKAAETIGQALSSAEELLTSLMDLATLESGHIVPDVADFPAEDVVVGSVNELRGMAERKGLKLRVRPRGDMIRSDPVLLKRIVRNLTINAIKYTDAGGVLVGCRRRGNSLRIDVWDTGRGIPDDKLALVFEEFYRGDESLDPRGGLGIGLAIVARVARLLGHAVTVNSRVGKGSLFAVTISLAEPGAAE